MRYFDIKNIYIYPLAGLLFGLSIAIREIYSNNASLR